MRDEEYTPDQIASYGEKALPALLDRMRPHHRMTQIGNGLALIAVVLAVIAQVIYPADYAGPVATAGMVTALVCSVLMLGICSFQHFVWARAMAEWQGKADYHLDRLTAPSWILHLVSYLIAVAGLWGCIAGSAGPGWAATSSVLLAFVLLFMIAAQICAAVQYLRTSGPPGTVPAHMRRLLDRANPRATRSED